MFQHPVNRKIMDDRTVGQKAADAFTAGFGTWTYIIIQTVVIVLWMVVNAIGFFYHWDAYPFILLNLGFSAQASYAAPLILMASNRSTERDRMVLEHEANETDEIFKIQDTQIELLKAIKAETALLCQVIEKMGGRLPEASAAAAGEPAG